VFQETGHCDIFESLQKVGMRKKQAPDVVLGDSGWPAGGGVEGRKTTDEVHDSGGSRLRLVRYALHA